MSLVTVRIGQKGIQLEIRFNYLMDLFSVPNKLF